ncbi:MAG: cotH 2 [Planctomycetota bacterium]|nr:cotH 2 [Planctomycetota bacterium]
MKERHWIGLILLTLVILPPVPLLGAQKEAQDKADVKRPAADVPGMDIFGRTKVWQIHLELTAKDFDRMQPAGGMRSPRDPGGFGPKSPDDKQAEKPTDMHKGSGFGLEFPWVHADLSAEGKTYKDVGLRYKGNASYGTTSRGLKRNFRVDLDHYEDELRFHGLKSIVLNAGGLDPSRGREAFSYAVFRAVGVPAPRTAFAEVTVTIPGKYDEEFAGLYTVVEHVDKTFLKDRFNNSKGLLMKPEGLRDFQYLGEDWTHYEPRYRPKHDPTDKEKRRVIEFAKLVDRGGDEEFRDQIASYLDVEQFLRFIAANAYLATIDNFFTGGHNYYLYLNPQTNKFVFIPWDMDVSLAGVPFVGTADQRMDLSLTHPHPGPHKLIDRLLAMHDVNESYQKLLKVLAGTAFSKERLLAEVDAIESVTGGRLAREKKATEARKEGAGGPGFGFAMGSGMFGQGPSLRTFVENRTASVAAQLAGERKGYVPAGGFGAPGGGPGEGSDVFGASSVVFHDKVQDELKLSDDQKTKLGKWLEITSIQTKESFQKAQDFEPAERGKSMHEIQRKANDQLDTFLKNTLKDDQRHRLRELTLQREGPFAVMQPDVAGELKIMDEQRQQLMTVIQELQRTVEPLMKEAQSGGNSQEIGPKLMKIRQEHEGKIEAILSDAQKKQWKQMLGKPFALGD